MKTMKTYALRNFRTIPQMDEVSESIKRDIEIVGRILPFKTNSYVVDELINWEDAENDAIFTLNFPRKEMLAKEHYDRIAHLLDSNADADTLNNAINEIRLTLNPNPANQQANVPQINNKSIEGMQHKYRETVLVFPSQGQTCHAYCTFCFRWSQFAGLADLKFATKEADLFVEYLKEHKEVTDVLFTGGDPMVMSSNILERYLLPLLEPELSHIRTIRIGSKSLAYWPYRFTTDKDSNQIIALFEKLIAGGKSISFQAQFNHPQELTTDAVKAAIKRIRSTGAQIRTQSPLLNHINKDANLWAEMWQMQVDLGCIPYYMFIARDTGAKKFFEVPLEQCWQIFRDAYKQVSGICRTVRGPSMSADPGKIQIVGIAEVKGEKVFVLNFLQGRSADWVGLPFFAKYDPKATWLSDLKPAFGEDKFFYEKELKEQLICPLAQSVSIL